MKRFIILILSLVVLFGCSLIKFGGPKQSREKDQRTEMNAADSSRAVIEAEINRMRQNKDFYYGFGYADVDENYSIALERAKNNAMRDLSRTIKSEVTYDMKRTLSNVSTINSKTYTETERDILEEKSRIYTDLVLSNIQGNKIYNDYPQQGVITYIVKKSINEYEEQVRKELTRNKRMISEIIITANHNFDAEHYMTAIHNWIMAKQTMNNIFGELPLQADIDKDGNEEELTSYLNDRVSGFWGGIQITSLNGDEFVYDALGNVDRNPNIYVKYIDDYSTEHDVDKLPLRIEIVEGVARVAENLTTGNYGQVELPINKIDGSNPHTSLKVEVDTDKISMLNLFHLPPVSTLTINLKKMRTITISVSFNNNGKKSSPSNLLQTIKSLAISQGFAVVESNLQKEHVSVSDFTRINKTNADYFLNLYISSTDARKVGGYENMYKATCSGTISLFKLPHGANIASEPLSVEEGFGASAGNASLNAYGKVKPKVQNIAQTILNRIK